MPRRSSPSHAYQRGVAESRWQADPGQQALLPELDRLHRALLPRAARQPIGWLGRRLAKPEPVHGLYLWGAVGHGKTLLMDLLHDSLPVAGKRRVHFHRFMGDLHRELRLRQGQAEPLAAIAHDWVARSRLFCLDEFLVHDIGDAMILGEFLRHLFAAGGCLVTTANHPPAQLYAHGLQRERFLPAIALLESHCVVRELSAAIDYRLRALRSAHTWWHPADAAAEDALAASFARLAPGSSCAEQQIMIQQRPIAVKCWADGIAWFDFAALCQGPRAVADYLELAQDFNTVLISKVPRFDASNVLEDAAKRFIHLVDAFYDCNVNLLASAAGAPMDLYHGQRHGQEFARTASRLIEMQSADYLGRAHLG